MVSRLAGEHEEPRAVKVLEAVAQHWSVALVKDVRTDLDDVIGSDAEDVGVERGVMDLAERETVGYDWIAALVLVGKDVRGVEQSVVVQAAHGAAPSIRAEDIAPEPGLV
jgi:hypothetical protein